MNLIDEREARDWLHLPQHTLQRLRHFNRGPRWIRIGRHILYDIADLEAWVVSCTRTPQNTCSNHSSEGDNHAC